LVLPAGTRLQPFKGAIQVKLKPRAAVKKTAAAGHPAEWENVSGNKTTGHKFRRIGDRTFEEKSDERRFKNLIKAWTAAGRGDFSVRLPMLQEDKLLDRLAVRFNAVVERNEAVTSEIIRVE
jgi:hypothetical protein